MLAPGRQALRFSYVARCAGRHQRYVAESCTLASMVRIEADQLHPSWRWLVSSYCKGRTWPARCLRAWWDLLSFTVSRCWLASAPTLTVCDLLIMIRGQLASFGLPWWRKGRPPN
jgi:hypothetical protein